MVDEVVTSYHEAGHAVLAERLGARVLVVTIVPVDDEGPRRHGETTIAWPASGINAETTAIQRAKVALAGPVAEMIYCDLKYEVEVIQEWWGDWMTAVGELQTLRGMTTRGVTPRSAIDLTINRLVHELAAWMSKDRVWERLARFADHLAAHETLEPNQLDELREWGVL